MKVLMIHAHYRQPGGEDESVRHEAELLRSAGFSVDLQELPPPSLSVGDHIRQLRSVRQTIADTAFDVVHFQNYFPSIPPSIYRAALDSGARVVQAVRNYRLSCIAATHYRNGAECLSCDHNSSSSGVRFKCYRSSRLQSALAASFMARHRTAQTWTSAVHTFLPVSEDVAASLPDVIPHERVIVKPNFAWDNGVGSGDGGFALCVGRLTPEKGVVQLLRAWAHSPELPRLLVVGDGPDREECERVAARAPQIEMLGQLPHSDVSRLMAAASVLVAPWRWREPFGRVIAEALSFGTPVVVRHSDRRSSVVGDGPHGAVFAGDDPASLANAVALFLGSDRIYRRQAARRRYEQAFSPSANLAILQRAYQTSAIVR